tara:strand:- start:4226 stop:4828 length:603 start_codon:yes stop_codon:yes gene_type:complete
MNFVPTVIRQTERGERAFDIFSCLLQDRIVILNGGVNEASAINIVAQLLFLQSEDPEKPIHLYINSPGGAITSGMAIHDTMKMLSCPVYTYGMGMCASMGAFLLCSGEQGHRYVLPNAEVMIHQPLGGAQGQATDIQIQAKRIQKLKDRLTGLIAEYSGQPVDRVASDCERDTWLDATDAVEYGLVDAIVNSPSDVDSES